MTQQPLPTRQAGLDRLANFVPKSGRAYAAERNYDRGPGAHSSVSTLSPYMRHRLVLEREIASAVTDRFAPSTAEKFISEVYWRGYFKGFLERRPSIWRAYRRDLTTLIEKAEGLRPLRNDIEAAEAGETGIDCFDHWAKELIATGYLHNHARMWFASIWIFTLSLPWQLGADFFLRHLLDGDPASNTLSWRWVGGLHTKGKHYIARPDNIARYTEGRFHPKGLNVAAQPLEETEDHPLRPVPTGDAMPNGDLIWLATEEDCAAETRPMPSLAGVIGLSSATGRSDRHVSADVLAFTEGAIGDQLQRLSGGTVALFSPELIIDAARQRGVSQVATAYAPVGPAADQLAQAKTVLGNAGITLSQVMRPEDPPIWERSDRGFFKVKKAIPKLLEPTF